MSIKILPSCGATKYLGRKLTFNDPHRTELENRISTAWRRFHMLKQELTGHRYSLRDRLRLFHGTVTPTVLYGCEAWTLTADLENRLRRTQRQMLRMILHAPRRKHNQENTPPRTTATTQQLQPEPTNDDTQEQNSDEDDDDVDSIDLTHTPPQPQDETEPLDDLEPWVDWIRRCTHEAEAHMTKLNLDDWVSLQRRRKWRWVAKLAITEADAWTTQTIRWDPTLDMQHNTRRRQGRPKTRWTDDTLLQGHRLVPCVAGHSQSHRAEGGK